MVKIIWTKSFTIAVLLTVFLALERASPAKDPLPSWNNGRTKQTILRFVSDVTDEDGESYVPPAERIAVFDNDGTLWAEQPLYFQLLFAMQRVRALAADHPRWERTQPFQAILQQDHQRLEKLTEHDVVEVVLASHAGMTTDEFQKTVGDWLATARHPRFGVPYTQSVYQPMLELLQHLRANDFKTFIVSGGGIDFVRVFSEDLYGIPPEQVVGSRIRTEFEIRDGEPVLVRLPEIDFINDKEGKPVGIHRHIGRRPILAFGNSDGDLAMLQYTAAGAGPRLTALLRHDDSQREYQYDRQSSIGRLDKALDEARRRGWTVVSVREDFRRVFPFGGK